MHFDGMAADYAQARPPYPAALYASLQTDGVIGPGRRVLEIGAGAGLATRELVARGTDVVAIEPGPELASLLSSAAPSARVIPTRLEDAALPDASFDAVVAATSMHWVDLEEGLPRLHRALRPGGFLAVWRQVFGDDEVPQSGFRHSIEGIVTRRGTPVTGRDRPPRPTMEELTAGGWFEPVRTERWRWSIDLTAEQIGLLFRTFSDWTAAEAQAARDAADDLGGTVTEHYQTVLHLLRRSPAPHRPPGSR